MKTIVMFIFMTVIMITGFETYASQFDHSIYNNLLKKYVADGFVDYQALKADRSGFTDYLHQIEQVSPDNFETWTKEKQLAFWINSYNAITIEGILRNYPIKWGGLIARSRFPKNSIRQIGGFWDKVFVKVMGQELTLNDIEHKILRKQFGDPRIHFVIVCASIGCPLLESRAFFPDELENRLEQSTYNFIKDPDKVRLDKSKNIFYLSSLFEWYAEDFHVSLEMKDKFRKYGKNEKGVIEFVVKYLSADDRNFVLVNQPKIKYLNYDWSLNERKQR